MVDGPGTGDGAEGGSNVRNATQSALAADDLAAQAAAYVESVQAQSADPLAETAPDPQANPAAPVGGTATVVANTPGSEGDATEPPTEYFGVDLSDLPAEARTSIIAGYKERDQYVQRLQQRNAELERVQTAPAQPAAPAPAPVEVAPLSDADLAAQLGIDLENDPEAETKASIAVPLARELMQLQQTVNQMRDDQLVDQTVNRWNDTLDGLEAQYGSLPPDLGRDDLFAIAAENGINDPSDAYWRVAGPARQSLQAEAAKMRAEAQTALKRAHAGQTRPVSSAPTSTKAVEEKSNVRLAVKEAMKLAQEETGLTWQEALNNRLS